MPLSHTGPFVTFYQRIPRCYHRVQSCWLEPSAVAVGWAAAPQPWLWGHQASRQDHFALQKVCFSIVPAVPRWVHVWSAHVCKELHVEVALTLGGCCEDSWISFG